MIRVSFDISLYLYIVDVMHMFRYISATRWQLIEFAVLSNIKVDCKVKANVIVFVAFVSG